ncbi:hypothetical protein D0T25_05560 [Duganella sp. BJB488]|nr:hypothetical protein D0T26_05600 [Duganella sp. BJB489]RFP26842.1 hypothetical protein D0T25_05560 [Duganella sp. BJB488]RFP34426.1 hypothetical protein D0T24_12470 [Duganella sp. BJB480]
MVNLVAARDASIDVVVDLGGERQTQLADILDAAVNRLLERMLKLIVGKVPGWCIWLQPQGIPDTGIPGRRLDPIGFRQRTHQITHRAGEQTLCIRE